MAVGRNKKPRSSPGRARRLPKGTPRPLVQPRARSKWYQTARGRGLIGLATIAIAVAGTGALVSSRSHQKETAQQQAALENYTSNVRRVLVLLMPPASAMQAAPTKPSDELSALEKTAATWIKQAKKAEERARTLSAPTRFSDMSAAFFNSASQYLSAAKSFRDAARAQGRKRGALLKEAMSQRDSAVSVWLAGVNLLDRRRSNLGMGASGITSPTEPSPDLSPTPEPSATARGPKTRGKESGGG